MSGPLFTGVSAAGRAVPVALLAALPGLVYAAGYDHLAYGLGLLAGLVLAGVMIAPRVAASGEGSISAALRDAFGPAAATVAGLVVIAVALPLLVAEFAVVGRVVALAFGVAAPAAIAAFLVLALAFALVWEGRPLAWLSALAWLLLAASLIVPVMLLAANAHGGWTFPHIAYGALLPDLQRIEETLVEQGLVDFDTFSAHTAPFIRLIERDVIALVLTLALGMAVLPHVVGAIVKPHRPGATRLSGAWAALFLMVLLISVPALAVYVKHAIYVAISKGTPLAALPAWLEAPLESGLAGIHGTSLHLFREIVAAAGSGARSAQDVADALAGTASAAQWMAIEPDVQQVMFAAAAHHILDPTSASLWEIYRGTVLPAAAAASGNLDGTLTQATLAIEPLGLMFVVPGLTGFPEEVTLLFAVAIVVATLAVTAGVIQSVARNAPGATQLRTSVFGIVAAFAVAIAAAGVAFAVSIDPVTLVVSALAIAAAGLFPALALGLAWRRATAAGVIAAMLTGAAVTGYYMAATQLTPASFYATWPMLSDAGEYAIEEYETLGAEASDAATEAERQAAVAAMDDLARGSATRAGLANWGGIDSASSGIFGAAVGLVVLILVSIVTPSRGRRRTQP